MKNGRHLDQATKFALVAAACALATPAQAQDADGVDEAPQVVSRPVVQAIPTTEGMTLNTALAQLARNPRDSEALINAGRAALVMGDADAAIGFFQRADQITPGNARVKAGLAGAFVRSGDPFSAIPLFEEAERSGAVDAAFIGDRALAYDLVGDNQTAQTYYQQALERGAGDEITRNYALSLAITRDRRGMEAVLSPLLQRQDKAAWRIRAFSLAILGQPDEAEAIAYASMPQDMAAAMSPYLRYMARLTPAQQAAAANFGHFPRAADIGRDDPRVAAYARPVVQAAAASPATQAPAGQSSNRNDRASRNARRNSARTEQARVAAAAPPPVPQPTRIETSAPAAVTTGASPRAVAVRPPVATPAAAPVAAPVAPPAAVQVAVAQPAPVAPTPTPAPIPAATPAPSPAVVQVAAGTPAVSAAPGFTSIETPAVANPAPGFDLAQVTPTAAAAAPTQPAATAPVSTPAPTPVVPATLTTLAAAAPPPPVAPTPDPAAPARRPSLAEAFADLAAPAAPAAQPEVAAGAVDIRRIAPARPARVETPARPAAAATARPATPTHPSRIWVQLATGRDRSALGFDWRRMAREADAAFRGRQPAISAWGQSNRLLAGPFESEAAANAFIAQLRRAQLTGMFLWTSPAGQVVDTLPLR